METSVSPDRFSSSLDLGGVSCFSVPRFACSSGQVAALRQRGGTTAIGIKLLEESTRVFDSMLVELCSRQPPEGLLPPKPCGLMTKQGYDKKPVQGQVPRPGTVGLRQSTIEHLGWQPFCTALTWSAAVPTIR